MSVIIVDPATGGVAGLYLDAFRSIDARHDCTLVGAYSSIPPMQKAYFYPWTDLASGGHNRFGRFRLPLRYMELIFGLLRTFLLIIRKRPIAVFYALSSNLLPELLFTIAVKLIGIRVFIICHDVVPFVSSYENQSINVLKRRQFYRVANKLLCHNKRSPIELNQNYGISIEKIHYIPFPILDLRVAEALLGSFAPKQKSKRLHTQFLFIGHVRVEKGINVLIDAWKMVAPSIINARLVIAGQIPPNVALTSTTAVNMTLIDHYIDEAQFIKMIREADIVILPYLAGTNSGILSSVISLGCPVIVSDIEMFTESGLAQEHWVFPNRNAAALAAKIQACAGMARTEIETQSKLVKIARDRRVLEFSRALDELLTDIQKQEI